MDAFENKETGVVTLYEQGSVMIEVFQKINDNKETRVFSKLIENPRQATLIKITPLNGVNHLKSPSDSEGSIAG